MQYHGLLDWRLALDMARLARDQSAVLDLASDLSSTLRNPWKPLVDRAQAPVSRTMAQFGFSFYLAEGHPCFVSKRRKKVLIACHPLWTTENASYLAVERLLLTSHPDCSVSPMNMFMVIRRPADYI
jgi:hypothetical protein